MVDLNGHEAGNGGYSHRKPTPHRDSSTRKLVRMPDYNSHPHKFSMLIFQAWRVGIFRVAAATDGGVYLPQ
jgi:hypothetical protein